MRASGILMHISSLPGPGGIGSMGRQARQFVDFLHRAKQRYWQILPLSPTGYGDSPYQSFSVFAGNPYLIDLERLEEQGLLRQSEIDEVVWSSAEDRVDYGILYENRRKVLYKAYERFLGIPNRDFTQFVQTRKDDWLGDYALFMALKEKFGGKDWQTWPEDIRLRQFDAMARCRDELKYQVVFQYFLQYKFFEQWNALRAYAARKQVQIIGDVPIYVPLDSADVWANYELFQLDEERRPRMVAGCPPDAFTADGQLWGNPLYDWERMKKSGYAWWIRRLRAASGMYDVIRLDHFRGFESYWAVPSGEKTARNGSWLPGPGQDFVQAMQKALPDLRFIAEDLGFLTEEVHKLQEASGWPGMKVLEFAFDSREPSNYLPHRYERHSVCYTGTHDNMTLCQWMEEARPEDLDYARRYLGLNEEEGYTWGMLRGGMSSVSDLFVAQMQDYLELPGSARMNLPGTCSPDNWSWRALEGAITPDLADRIAEMTQMYGRAEDNRA